MGSSGAQGSEYAAEAKPVHFYAPACCLCKQLCTCHDRYAYPYIIFIYIYIYISYIYIYIHTYISISISISISICISISIYIYIYMHIHTCMRCLCLRSCLPSSVVLNCKHMSFHMSILGLEPQPQKKLNSPRSTSLQASSLRIERSASLACGSLAPRALEPTSLVQHIVCRA